MNFKLKHSRIQRYHFGFIFTSSSFLITNLRMPIPKYVEKSLLEDVEETGLGLQEVCLVDICDKKVATYGPKGKVGIRRKVQKYFHQVKQKSFKNYVKLLDEYKVKHGANTSRLLRSELESLQSEPEPKQNNPEPQLPEPELEPVAAEQEPEDPLSDFEDGTRRPSFKFRGRGRGRGRGTWQSLCRYLTTKFRKITITITTKTPSGAKTTSTIATKTNIATKTIKTNPSGTETTRTIATKSPTSRNVFSALIQRSLLALNTGLLGPPFDEFTIPFIQSPC
jgi:hypothetical protein